MLFPLLGERVRVRAVRYSQLSTLNSQLAMHSLETKNQFIELRAEGLSLDAISSQLDVPRSTLGRWHHESIEQIQRLRSLQWHLLEEQIGHRLEDSLQRVAHRIRRWEDELDTRDPHCRTTIELVRIIRDSRREYLQLRALLLAPLQPTRGRAACLTSLDPQKRDKTRQNSNALDPTPLPANDLQQPNPAPSHSPVTPEVTRGLTSSEPSSNNLNPNLNPNPDPSLESPAIDSSSASSCLCCKPTNQVAESHGVITEPPINTPLQRGEPAEPLAPPTASAVSPSAPPSAAESSQLITPNDASPALPLPGGEGRGEGGRNLSSRLCRSAPARGCGLYAFSRSRGVDQKRILPSQKPCGGCLLSWPIVEQGVD